MASGHIDGWDDPGQGEREQLVGQETPLNDLERSERDWALYLRPRELKDFCKPRGCMSLRMFLFFRGSVALYFIAITIYSLVKTWQDTPDGPWWPIYLTNWTLFLVIAYFSCAWTSSFYYSTNLDGIREAPKLIKATWVLQNIASSVVMLVFLVYWLLMWDWKTVNFEGISVHLMNFAAIIVDRIYSCAPMRIRHVYMPIAFLAVYGLFAIIQDYSNLDNGSIEGTAIYAITDFKQRPELAWPTVAALFFVLTPLNHVFMCILASKSGKYLSKHQT
eukprot:CAMPEP_0114488132 /NCGR_PEP_ID=MMETSP0109-20121206/1155_1 /TAXON_ID=29199 /ORGANISM="Chlorarachnion reptans, Strain CCCM449" /LENGTH=275 /DNA_ID=CAMNT_0001664481 /DNA_START=164 /DNA_END=991 /DNA_ORIENTATION=+